jgi:Fe-S cluster assembly scaffold protein SufB
MSPNQTAQSATKTPWPSSRLEAWKYTDLQELAGGLSRSDIAANPAVWCFSPHELSGLIADCVSSGELRSQSDTLREIIHAGATGGWQICIPAGSRPEHPLRVSYAPLPSSGWSAYHHQIHLAKDARITLIEEFELDDSHEDQFRSNQTKNPSAIPVDAMALHHLGVHLEAGAELTMIRLFRNRQAQAMVHQADVYQEEDSQLRIQSVAMGSGTIRNNIHIQQHGNACSSNLLGLSWSGGGGHIDQYSRIQHQALDGNSHQHYKAIAGPNSTTIFNGVLRVEPNAQQTNAYQRSSNLMLDPASMASDKGSTSTLRSGKVNAKPELQIFADNVKCSHGATMGKLNTDSIFYLQSRGLSFEEAQRMLTLAFAMEIVDQLEDEGIRAKVKADLDLPQWL